MLLTYTNERKGRDALQFIVDVTTGREDAKYIKHGELPENTKYNKTVSEQLPY